MSNERDIEIQMAEQEFWSMIESNFDLRLETMSTTASSSLCGPISLTAGFPSENKRLKGTDYYFTDSNKIIHFTSMNILLSIVNEGALRMYNLHNSNDKNEYSYAASELKNIYQNRRIDESRIEKHFDKIKENSFITSTTSVDELNNPSFWQKYGDGGKGVAIELEVINNMDKWKNFYLSKVQYNKLNAFKRLVKAWNLIQKKYPINIYDINLDFILSMHKSSDWENENEIRLLTFSFQRQLKTYEELIHWDFKPNKIGVPIKYFKLPLCDDDGNFINRNLNDREEFFWSDIPKIRISDIYFGPDFPINDNLSEYQYNLKHYIHEKLKIWLRNLQKNKMQLK